MAILNATQIERDAVPNTRGATETEPGVFRCMDPEELYRRIAQAKEEADYVIVFVHWGTEKETSPDWLQLEQKEGMEKAGADLIIGAHPHVLQGITFENDTPVVYSLGNFLFTSYTIDTGLLQVTFSPKEKKLSGLRLVPMRQEGATVKLLQGAEKEAHLDKLRELSPGVVIDDEGGILLP